MAKGFTAGDFLPYPAMYRMDILSSLLIFSLSPSILLKRMRSYIGISKTKQRITIKRYHQSNWSQVEMRTNPLYIKNKWFIFLLHLRWGVCELRLSHQATRRTGLHTLARQRCFIPVSMRVPYWLILLVPQGRSVATTSDLIHAEIGWVAVKLDFPSSSSLFRCLLSEE